MTFFYLLSVLLLLTASCRADLLSNCSARSDSYYIDGICYIAEQYNTHNSLSSSCQSLNTNGQLIDVHTSHSLANISTTLYDPKKGDDGLPSVYFNGYILKIGDEIRFVGRFHPDQTHGAIYLINSNDDIPIIIQLDITDHNVQCWSIMGGNHINYDTATNDPTHVINEVNNAEFDIKLKISPNGYEIYFDNTLVHTCPQNQTYHEISYTNGWASPTSAAWVVDLVTINGKIYGGQKLFWSSILKRDGIWIWENSGLTVESNYAGWTDGHPEEESDKECALLDGNSGRLLTANCNQRAAAVCQYIEPLGPDPRYTFSVDVKDKKVSASSFLAQFTTKSSIVCLVKCGQVSTCKSVAYNNDTGHCELHDIYGGHDIIDATGYEIYNKI